MDFHVGVSKTLSAECPFGKLDLGIVADNTPLNAVFSAKRLQTVFSFISDCISSYPGCYIDMGNKIERFGGHTAFFAAVAANDTATRKVVLAPIVK